MMIVPPLLLILTAFAGVARAADQTWHCMGPGEVAKHEVRADNLVLGDIKLVEQKGGLTHLPVIQASFVAHNQRPTDVFVALEILGSNDKGPVFAISVAPGFGGTVSPKSDQPATATVFAAPGELARAAQICVRFVGDF
jgi:hypothetical protein